MCIRIKTKKKKIKVNQATENNNYSCNWERERVREMYDDIKYDRVGSLWKCEQKLIILRNSFSVGFVAAYHQGNVGITYINQPHGDRQKGSIFIKYRNPLV